MQERVSEGKRVAVWPAVTKWFTGSKIYSLKTDRIIKEIFLYNIYYIIFCDSWYMSLYYFLINVDLIPH